MKSKPEKPRVSVPVTRDERRRLKHAAAELETTMSELVRQGFLADKPEAPALEEVVDYTDQAREAAVEARA